MHSVAPHWHFTEGWGSFGTIVVAVLAIIVSAFYNRRTLRQARDTAHATLALGRQQRDDQRSDVLRTEIANLLTSVDEVLRKTGELEERVRSIDAQIKDEAESDHAEVDHAEIDRRMADVKRAVGQVFAEPLANFATQSTQIKMLTADEDILGPLHQISRAIVGKAKAVNSIIDLMHQAAKQPQEQQANVTNHLIVALLTHAANDAEWSKQIANARSHLINHAIKLFNPAAIGAIARIAKAQAPKTGV